MAPQLDRRGDGTLVLYVDGDLQFDSRDEAIYHETLALPALALAESRQKREIHALICGGGDGLIARELLKSPLCAQIDLVEIDPEVLEMARKDLATLNVRSLSDSRVQNHVGDAWEFVSTAAQQGRSFELVVVDLTVPQEVEGARFHSVEWYSLLSQLLGRCGVLAVNGLSPCGAPDAYWSVYNSMRAALLNPRPLRVALPSFQFAGYGEDWGFFLASPQPIRASELRRMKLAGPHRELKGTSQLRKLFLFPGESAARRLTAAPTHAGSDLLLQYVYGGNVLPARSGVLWDGLAFHKDIAPLPPTNEGNGFLPAEVRDGLRAADEVDERVLLANLFDLMPALHRSQTREMVAAFLEDPSRFLDGIDLSELVRSLLARAAELPRRLVAELRHLSEKLGAALSDRETLLSMGLRVVTVIALVVIVGNLLFPDNVYGKGGTSASGSAQATTMSIASSGSHAAFTAPAETSAVKGSGFRSDSLGRKTTIDETGTLYPSRSYRFRDSNYYFSYHRYYYRDWVSYPDADALGSNLAALDTKGSNEGQSYYRLTPEADLLDDGRVVVNLTDSAYLLLGDEMAAVVDRDSGDPLLFLERDPALIFRVSQEISRQTLGLQKAESAKRDWIRWIDWLEFAPWREGDLQELSMLKEMQGRLGKAAGLLGPRPQTPPEFPAPPSKETLELFTGVWIQQTGDALALRLADGSAYLDGSAWYRDEKQTEKLNTPYPTAFRDLMVGYLTQRVEGAAAERDRMQQDKTDLQAEIAALESDRVEYEAIKSSEGEGTSVEYGSSEIPCGEALRRTYADLEAAKQQMVVMDRQMQEQPSVVAAAQRFLSGVQK